MEKLLCPSMMCANYRNLEKEVNDLIEAGVDIFHIDIMDGQFVPNFGMGLQDVEYICKASTIPVDAHLMIENPGNYVEKFAKLGIDIIYIHPESDVHPTRTLQSIIDLGVKPGIAINPGTAVETIKPLLPFVDYVMVMSVNPGFSGQKYISSVDEKIAQLVELKEKYGLSYLFITHDLTAVTYICDRVLFFKDGQVVETVNNTNKLKYVKDEYSKLLLGSVLDIEISC